MMREAPCADSSAQQEAMKQVRRDMAQICADQISSRESELRASLELSQKEHREQLEAARWVGAVSCAVADHHEATLLDRIHESERAMSNLTGGLERANLRAVRAEQAEADRHQVEAQMMDALHQLAASELRVHELQQQQADAAEQLSKMVGFVCQKRPVIKGLAERTARNEQSLKTSQNLHRSLVEHNIALRQQVSELREQMLSLIHISEPTRLLSISYAVFCLKKKKPKTVIY
eukprot:TRINITY_DN6945_c0_g1_i1.p1 TRINITY_DN6945_c0_g1~~TRINITY_DN6945_c0_g1_i1.p1  ORF type:complete len:234 (+),score=68.53 TRINITY_DN6945_c0_g1_i1:187-888(+)